MAVKMMMMMFFWVLALCRLTGRYLCFSEMVVSTTESTWHQNPEHHHHQITFTLKMKINCSVLIHAEVT
jgi:hypothetical protein